MALTNIEARARIAFSATTIPILGPRVRLFMGEWGMRTLVIALAAIALLIAPAHAQGRGKGRYSPSQQQSAEQKQKAAEAEKAYKAALDKIPEPDRTREECRAAPRSGAVRQHHRRADGPI